ncbi:histidine kinase dimerization/phosphoacceptor domain -containing protein [Mucilaginibacter terrae]|nr:histidine kinase dimerization/phosphoacceptor domain -containing protein [Mucilaginibacter terrae]
MKNAFLCIFLLLTAIPALAQTSNLDELPMPVLRQKLATSTNDTNKVQVQLALGHLMLQKPVSVERDIDSARKFASQASVLSRQLNYHFGIINSMLLNSEIATNQGDRETGLKIAQNVLAFSQKHHNSDGEARSYHLIAQCYQRSDPVELHKRIFYINKSIAIFRKNRNALWLSYLLTANADLLFQAGRTTEGLRLLFEALNLGKGVSRRTVEGIYWNIGRTSFRLGDYTNALKYNLLALRTAREVNDTTLQISVINHFIASTYIKMQDYGRAIPYSLEVLKLAKRYNDSDFVNTELPVLASEYMHNKQVSKALSILNELKSRAHSNLENLSVSVDFLNNLIYAKRLVEADQYAQEVKRLLALIPPDNLKEVMNAYNALASYYSETGQVKQAYHYTELYANMAHKLNYIAGIRTAEYRYYKLVSLKGDLKSAMAHLLKEQEIKDSIDNAEKAYQISLLHIENETLEKNRHIDSLTRQAQIKDSKLKRNQLIQNVTIAGAVMLLTITGLIYSRYRLKQRSNNLLTLQKSEIDEKNTALQHLVIDKNELLEDKDRLLLEKDLLLKEVNHRVKNNLQIVMNLLHSQSVYLSNESAQQAILESQNRVRSIALIHDQLYKTEHISQINLSSYIKELILSLDDSLNQKTNNVAIVCNIENIALDVSQAIPLGIVLNEMVTNALKYAFPNDKIGSIKIVVKQTGSFIEMQISDNGVGLPADFDLESTKTLGITLLKGLTAQLKGTFAAENNNGLTITLRFPVEVPINQAQLLNT